MSAAVAMHGVIRVLQFGCVSWCGVVAICLGCTHMFIDGECQCHYLCCFYASVYDIVVFVCCRWLCACYKLWGSLLNISNAGYVGFMCCSNLFMSLDARLSLFVLMFKFTHRCWMIVSVFLWMCVRSKLCCVALVRRCRYLHDVFAWLGAFVSILMWAFRTHS